MFNWLVAQGVQSLGLIIFYRPSIYIVNVTVNELSSFTLNHKLQPCSGTIELRLWANPLGNMNDSTKFLSNSHNGAISVGNKVVD